MSRPTEIISGDTYEYDVSSPDYPASDGWTLKVTYTNAAAFKRVTAATADNGTDYTVTLAVADTTALSAGTYDVLEAVEKPSSGTVTERHTISRYSVTVKANIAGISAATDMRSHAQKMLTLIQTAMELSAGREYVAISVDGQQTQLRSWIEMRKEEAFWQSRVDAEEAKGRAALGLATGRNYHIRFV
jgi:hypothetical protein